MIIETETLKYNFKKYGILNIIRWNVLNLYKWQIFLEWFFKTTQKINGKEYS